MKLKKLRHESDLLEYQEKTHAKVGVLYPMDYLRKARVYALVEDGKIQAGFFFISKGPLRTVQSLPSNCKVEKRLTEISGIWINSSEKTQAMVLKFWFAMSVCALPELGRTLIFTYSTSKPGLRKMYAMFSPTEIYNGPVAALEGMEKDDVESINIAPAHSLAFSPILNPRFFYQKAVSLQYGGRREYRSV